MSERLKPAIKVIVPLLLANTIFVFLDYYVGDYIDFVYELIIPANFSIPVAKYVNLPETIAFLNPLFPQQVAIVPVLKYITLFPLFFVIFRLIMHKIWE